MGSFLGGITGTTNGFVAQGADINKQDFNPALGNSAGQFNDIFGQQSGLAQQLQQSANGQGPNPAQIQLQQATNQNISQNAGMLASQRGLSPALAQRLASQNAAATQQQSAGQGALMGAQQQLAARGQLAGLLGQQQQGALGMNSTLQNAQAQQNSALVGQQNGLNSSNAQVSMGNQQNNSSLMGGMLGGIGSAFGFAQGGVVPQPQMMAKGGALSAVGQMLGGGGDNPYAGFSQLGSGLRSLFGGGKDAPSGDDYSQYSDSGFDPKQMALEHSRQDAYESGGLPAPAPISSSPDSPAPQAGGPGMYAPVVGDPFAGVGPSYQVGKPNPDMMPFAQGGMAGLRMAYGGDPAGKVGGQAQVAGNSLANDKVPAMLSPKEIVLPRSITMHPNAPALAAEFVRRELHKHHADSKKNFDEGGAVESGSMLDKFQKFMAPDFQKAEQQKRQQQSGTPGSVFPMDVKHTVKNYDEGGQVPPGLNANAPEMQLEPAKMGFDPGQEFIPAPKTNYGDAYEQKYQELRKMNPGEPEAFSRASALTMAEGMKKADEMSQNWNQYRAQSGMQASHDDAVAENTRRQALGLPPVPVPEAPAVVGQQIDQTQPDTSLNKIPDMNAMGGGMNPMSQMDKTMGDAYMRSANEQKAGLNQAANVQGQLGQQNARIAQDSAQREQGLMNDFQTQNQQLRGEFDAAMKDYKDGHINPNHYAESIGSVGKVKTAIGLILGGMGGGLLHQENPALKFLNSQIDRDMDAQKAELGKKANLLNANIHKMGNLRDATEMTRAMMMGIQANQFREAAANAQGPMAKAAALQHAGEIDERLAPIMSQIAMRQTMMRGMQSGQVDPGMAIRFMAPEGQQQELMKQYASAQGMAKQKDNLLNAFDQVNKIANVQSHLASPLQASRQADALTEPLLAQLIKDSEGRITPQDTEMMKGLFPRVGDSDSTRRLRRNQLNKFISEKMNFPALAPYGYNPHAGGRYDAHGMDRLPPMAPPK